MPGEYFSSGSDYGHKMMLGAIVFNGVIWVVDVNQDVEELKKSKDALHDLIFSTPHFAGECLLQIVYNNKRQDYGANRDDTAQPIFMREKIAQRCAKPWVDCPFDQKLLDLLFEVEKLKARLKT